jgi:predicted Zn-dependent protease
VFYIWARRVFKNAAMKNIRPLVLTSFIVLASCLSAQEKAQQLTATAAALFNIGRYGDARTTLLRAIAKRDDSPDEWLLLARTELQLSHPYEALNAYTRLLELEATNPEALQMTGELAFQLGRYREAITAADRMLSLNPGATRAMLVKGLVALDQRHLPEAQAAADAILKISPNDEYAAVLKGRVLAIGHDYAAAVKVIEATPEAQRTEASIATLIEIYRSTGDSKQLIATMSQLVSKRPKDTGLNLEYAQTLYKAGENARARSVLMTLINDHPDDYGLVSQVSDLWTESDRDAIGPDDLARIVAHGSTVTRIGVARYLQATGRSSSAEDVLRTPALSGDANALNADARALYATLIFERGDAAGAARLVDALLDTDKSNKDALLLRARMAENRGDLTAALNDLQIVVRDSPQNEQGQIALANLFIARKDLPRARQIYETAIAELPQSLVLLDSYSVFLYQSGDMGRAMSIARNFTLRNPNTSRGWALFSRTCAKAANNACAQYAAAGQKRAAASFEVDERPGRVRSRGLFGKL